MPPRPNPESFEGSLVWWVEVPARRQNYLQAVLEGHDDIGYYQTLVPRFREGEGGEPLALGRLTSSPDAQGYVQRLMKALGGECGLRLLEGAPDIAPDEQPGRD